MKSACAKCLTMPQHVECHANKFLAATLLLQAAADTSDKQNRRQAVVAYRGKHVFEALLHKLMGSADQLKPVDLVEFSGNSCSKQPACSSRADCPSFSLLWITPHKITERSLMWDLTHPFYRSYLHQVSIKLIHMKWVTTWSQDAAGFCDSSIHLRWLVQQP